MGTHTAQIVTALATSAAIVVALVAVVTAVWALRSTGRGTRAAVAEIRHDRDLQIRPHLAFAPTLPGITTREVAFVDIPGVDASVVQDALAHMPEGGSVVVCDPQADDAGYGRLRNYGNGAAIDVCVRFQIDDVAPTADVPTRTPGWVENRQSAGPDEAFTYPRDIAPGATARVMHLPAMVSWDVFRTVGSVRGTATIACTDIAGNRYEWSQQFAIWAFYPDPSWTWTSTRLVAQFGEVTSASSPNQPA